ncbi:MAG: hypothetical protein AB1782_01655 [Cyanobacteriota bacterium]
MKDFNVKEKIIIFSFIVITIFVLWLISPMGKLYLPIKADSLEADLNFKLPGIFTIKNINESPMGNTYHLYNSDDSPQLISIIPVENQPLTLNDIRNDVQSNPKLALFWSNSKFKDVIIKNCEENNNSQNIIGTCDFEAEWPDLNYRTFKEGQITLIKKDNKYIFIMASSSKMAYNPKLLKILVKSILSTSKS